MHQNITVSHTLQPARGPSLLTTWLRLCCFASACPRTRCLRRCGRGFGMAVIVSCQMCGLQKRSLLPLRNPLAGPSDDSLIVHLSARAAVFCRLY